MPTTTRLALPYPAASDPADIPKDLQSLADKLDPLVQAATPRCKVTRTAFQSVAAGSLFTVPWDSDTATSCYDTDNMWGSGTPTVIKATTAGLYLVQACIGWSTPSLIGSYRRMVIQNSAGRLFCDTTSPPCGLPFGMNISAVVPMNANDTVALLIAHNDNVASSITQNADATYFAATMLSRLT